MFLIDAIKLNVEKKFKTFFIFYATCLGKGSGAYKIKQVFFFLRWRQQQHYSKGTRKRITRRLSSDCKDCLRCFGSKSSKENI